MGIRFDDVLTLSDYDLKNYTNLILGRNNICTVFAKDFFILFDFKKFTSSDCVLSFNDFS